MATKGPTSLDPLRRIVIVGSDRTQNLARQGPEGFREEDRPGCGHQGKPRDETSSQARTH
jgi:hypothetical protein